VASRAGFKPQEKRTEWDEVGDVDGAFCRNCGSYFCPHVAPSMYPSPVTGHEYEQLAKLLELQKQAGVTGTRRVASELCTWAKRSSWNIDQG
jgi:hypothetical protein